MKRNAWSWLAGAMIGVGTLSVAPGCIIRVRPAYVVDEQPPVAREEVVTARPGYVWVRGRWERHGRKWTWNAGHWRQARGGYVWVDGYWDRRGNRYHWVEGHWAPPSGGAAPGRVEVRDHGGGAPAPAPTPAAAPAEAPHHEHAHEHPHANGDHHHHDHVHPHRPGTNHHHPY